MKNQTSIRTSASHPLQISTVSLPGGGAIGITFCPGKCGPSISGFQWERDLDADLAVISDWGAQAVVTLIEDAEFRLLAVPDLGARVRDLGMAWHHLPITAMSSPNHSEQIVAIGEAITKSVAVTTPPPSLAQKAKPPRTRKPKAVQPPQLDLVS